MRSLQPNLAELDRNRSGLTFLVGDNGCGKSTNLVLLAQQATERNQPILAISNTVYDRFPRTPGSYGRLAGTFRRNLPSQALREAVMADPHQREQNLHRIGKVLNYLGFGDDIGISLAQSVRAYGTHSNHVPPYELENMRRMFDSQPEGIIWLRSSESGYAMSSLNILSLLHHNGPKTLGRHRLTQIEFYLRKGHHILKLDSASSGELTLLATYAFIASNIREGTLLLIDEPENSLHPKWQHEYCLRLLDMFYLYSPQIIIATHSPVIVSGAQAHNLPIEILEVQGATLIPREVTSSIEATLYESFQTLSPSNHFLSEQVAQLLDALNRRELSEFEFERQLLEFKSRSYDQTQLKFLADVRELGRSVMVALREGGNE